MVMTEYVVVAAAIIFLFTIKIWLGLAGFVAFAIWAVTSGPEYRSKNIRRHRGSQ